MPGSAMTAAAGSARGAGAADPTRPPTILLLSPSGWGNLGDAAIIDATVAAIRGRWATARIVGVTLSPADTERRHGIEATLLAGRSLSGYGMIGRPERGEHPLDNSLPGTSRLSQVPFLRKPVRAVNDAVLTALAEPGHSREARRLVAQADLVFAAGGGQLDEFWGGPWGHPFALYKWGRLARRAGVPFALLSVGMCELETRLARWFVRRALALADYRSFRDQVSSRRAQELGVRGGLPVVPDLAFAVDLPVPTVPVGLGPRLRVGVSPIAYRHPDSWPGGDASFFDGYLTTLATFVRELLADDCDVSLFATDWCDWAVVDSLVARLSEGERGRVQVADTRSVTTLLTHVAGLDLVVASRLHGVLLSQRAGRPTIAFSYDLKVDTLMADMGLSRYCLPIESGSSSQLLECYRQITRSLPEVQDRVQRNVAAFGGRVSAQFDHVLGANGLLARR